jgi:hypothetical protein
MSAAPISVASHKRRPKRQDKTLAFWTALKRVLEPYPVISVRGAYYQAEMAGIVGKTEDDYNRVQRALLDMRRDGYLPYEKICDNSRERRSIYQCSGLRGALEDMQNTYRRNYWLDQPVHVEIWCEKDALTPIINPICQRYGVMFCAIRGFESESFTYTAAQDLREIGKPARIYYFGDHDPSGWFIANSLEEGLREFGVDVTVHPVAVNPDQIMHLRLPTRVAKRSDTRRAAFVREFGSDLCTEVDAIPPTILQDMVEQAILGEIDRESWARVARVEELERSTLANVLEMYGNVAPGTRYKAGAA